LKFINFETKINRISQKIFAKKIFFNAIFESQKSLQTCNIEFVFFLEVCKHTKISGGGSFCFAYLKKLISIFLEVCK
jgi:hypothetical protein